LSESQCSVNSVQTTLLHTLELERMGLHMHIHESYCPTLLNWVAVPG